MGRTPSSSQVGSAENKETYGVAIRSRVSQMTFRQEALLFISINLEKATFEIIISHCEISAAHPRRCKPDFFASSWMGHPDIVYEMSDLSFSAGKARGWLDALGEKQQLHLATTFPEAKEIRHRGTLQQNRNLRLGILQLIEFALDCFGAFEPLAECDLTT